MTIAIKMAAGAHDYEAFGELCRDYVCWCRKRYESIPWFVEEVFGYQSLEEELKGLDLKYGPPKGRTLLVEIDGQIVAGGAYRKLSDTICELKRLYVADSAKGRGVGRALSEALLASARADGFTLMQLDTGNLLTEAIAMYEKMGFNHCAPYRTYPDKLMPYLVFMERAL
jgi:GNAT superfamily N-acetyltransferase